MSEAIESIPVMLPANFPVFMPVVMSAEKEAMPEIELPGIYDVTVKDEFIIPDPIIENVAKILMDGNIFKEIFGSISALVPECIINLNQTGISVKCVDVANVALIALDYKKDMFEMFKGPEKPEKIGIDISHIIGLKTMIKKGSLVLIEFTKKTVPAHKVKNYKKEVNLVDEKTEYYYSVSIEGTETKDKALEVSSVRKEPKEPEIELSVNIDLKSEYFIQGIKDGSKVSDKVALIFEDTGFSMVFEGDTRTMNKNVQIVNGESKTGKTVRSLFSIDYLKDIVKTLNKSEIITLKIGKDCPMKLIRENEVRTIIFMLAPRIEAN